MNHFYYCAVVQYDGTNYRGWQSQKEKATVQLNVEQAVSKFLDSDIKVYAAGRTDTGVHATAQVINFCTDKVRSPAQYLKGINYFLPADISLLRIYPVDQNFHARYSASSRIYNYLCYSSPYRLPIWDRYATRLDCNPDILIMNEAIKSLLGKRDFIAWRSSNCQSKNTVKTLFHAEFTLKDNLLLFSIEGSSFLRHMVRRIIDVLLQVGLGHLEATDIAAITEQKKRFDYTLAPAKGLHLVGVKYSGYPSVQAYNPISKFYQWY